MLAPGWSRCAGVGVGIDPAALGVEVAALGAARLLDQCSASPSARLRTLVPLDAAGVDPTPAPARWSRGLRVE